jgi:hypothetical protein
MSQIRSRSLLGFCEAFGIPAGDAAVKDAIRKRIMKGRPFTPEEEKQIKRYGGGDVDDLNALLVRVLSYLDIDRALHRGEFSKVSAKMEHRGVPVNGALYRELADNWAPLRDALVPELDQFNIYVQDDAGGWHFNHDRFEDFLAAQGMTSWPRTETGRLSLTSKVFHDMTKGVPQFENLRQLKHLRDQLRSIDLAVGPDDRARTVLWPFKSITGRTQPAASEFPFSPATWIRNIIAPTAGWAIAYVDWSSMEFLIAAVQSGDPVMIEFYRSGDPYMSFAKRVGAVPKDATKKTHGAVRDRYKIGLLAIQYGISAAALAARLGVSETAAQEMINQHHALFRVYWKWATDWLNWALNHGVMWTNIDWRCAVGTKERSIINWPTQSVGGDILRLACIWADRHGIRLCAPVHDALLIEAPIDQIDRDAALVREVMRRASRLVLGGNELRTDATVVRYPDHYSDSRGDKIWAHVTALLARLKGSAA